jgi:hypothetical protein
VSGVKGVNSEGLVILYCEWCKGCELRRIGGVLLYCDWGKECELRGVGYIVL